MVDNAQQLSLVASFNATQKISRPWKIFIKVDVGSRRSGLPVCSPSFENLVRGAEQSAAIELYGFYCHAGHSYACDSIDAASGILEQEIEAVVAAANLVSRGTALILSIGATPTAHVIKNASVPLPQNTRLELHAGMSPAPAPLFNTFDLVVDFAQETSQPTTFSNLRPAVSKRKTKPSESKQKFVAYILSATRLSSMLECSHSREKPVPYQDSRAW